VNLFHGATLEWIVLAEVLGAMALGGLIGYEREAANRPAGFRTHMLVAGACALLVGLGDGLLTSFGGRFPSLVNADPFRLAGGVITALGFIGAGTIFRTRDGKDVEGLTTAASLLFSGAVGIGAALQQWVLAVGATLLALVVLRGLYFVEKRIQPGSKSSHERH
jgi:putative Mg2+ transporter-C (MgtC) family protein